MDEARIRRQRPTLAAQTGNLTSVLVGDCLFAHAVTLAAGFPTPDICRAVSTATKTVCSGEILQAQRQRQLHLTRQEYFRILRMKTGELFALSCALGAQLSGATGQECKALRDYGMTLGTAYQVYDDCMDLFGCEAAAGKSLGTDLAGGKMTLPMIAVMEQASPAIRQELEETLLHWEPSRMRRVLDLLAEYEAMDESRSVIRGFCDSARQALLALQPSEGRKRLDGLAAFLTQQTSLLGV
jgi:octaprenyl-diphosphate synthase